MGGLAIKGLESSRFLRGPFTLRLLPRPRGGLLKRTFSPNCYFPALAGGRALKVPFLEAFVSPISRNRKGRRAELSEPPLGKGF